MQGTNGAIMKENNRRLILSFIRHGCFSRTDIANATGLTKATVTGLTEELLKEGLISETTHGELNGAGRKPTYLALKENSRYIISFCLTREGYSAGIYNLGGKFIHGSDFEYEISPEKTVDKMADIIDRFYAFSGNKQFLGVGICCPGPVDYKNGKILNPPNFEAWHNFEIVNHLRIKCDLPIFVENISNSLALYERYFGSCISEKNYAYVVVDEGIGSGIIVNGDIYRGAFGYGNELGHITVEVNGKKCPCGNKGCLECYASIPAILSNTCYSRWQEVMENEDSAIIDQECFYLSAGLINLVNLFDLNVIVLGGDVATKDVAEKLSIELKKRTIVKHPITIYISDTMAIKGAAAASIVLHNLFF